MDADLQNQGSRLAKEHYKEIAKWAERVALLVLGSLAVYKIVLGEISDPVVYTSLVISFIIYFFAYQLLVRS